MCYPVLFQYSVSFGAPNSLSFDTTYQTISLYKFPTDVLNPVFGLIFQIESIAYHEDIIIWTIFCCNKICLGLDWVMGTLTRNGSLLRPLHHQRNCYHHYFGAFFELMNGKRVLCQDILMYKNLFDFELTLRIEWMFHIFHTLRALKWIKMYQGPSVLNSQQCS